MGTPNEPRELESSYMRDEGELTVSWRSPDWDGGDLSLHARTHARMQRMHAMLGDLSEG